MNRPSGDQPINDQILNLFNSKNKIQVIIFICAIFLIVLLGFKLYNIEQNNTNYDALLN